MRKIKKMIASLTAAMMLFSFAAPAMAADAKAAVSKAAIGKDVKGTKYETDAKKLISLGIINGFEDGTVRPDATVTRAQFAAIVAQELGIAEGVGPAVTKFKDVPSSHWASGVINLAVGKGIIYGFGDGTFKPDAPVTYAQAYAMLTQMLGYGPALKGAAWPSGVLAKAASLGVSKGVAGAANAEMKRGDVIRAASNSLTIDIMEQDEYGDSNVYKKQDKTILSEVFNITVFNDSFKNGDDDKAKGYLEVDNVPMIDLGGLKADEIEFAKELTGKYTVSSALNPNEFLGQNVEAWVDEDEDVVLYLGVSDDETVITDTIDEVTGGEMTLKDEDEDYEIADKANIWINIADSGYGQYGDEFNDADLNLDGASVKVVLNSDDEIIAAVITDWSQGATGYVTEVNADDESIEYNDAGSDDDLDLSDADFAVVKDGAPATLADIKVGDIVSYLDGDKDEVYVAVSSAQVKGTADISWGDASDSADDFDITIGDVKYDVNATATYSDNGNEDIEDLTPADLKDLNDENITVYLDVKGDVAHVVSGDVESSSNDLVGVITKEARYNSYDDEVKFEMVNKAGQELTFKFDPDDVKVDGYSYANVDIDGADWEKLFDLDTDKLNVVKYKLDSAGNLDKIEEYSDFESDSTFDVNEDDQTITVGTGDYNVTDKTIIFDVTDTVAKSAYGSSMDDVKTVKWDSIKDEDKVTGKVIIDGDNVEYLFVTDGSLTSDGLYGVVTGFASNADGDDQVKLLLPDGSISKIVLDETTATSYVYKDTGSRDLKKGDFIRYELNTDGEIDSLHIVGKAEGGIADESLTKMTAAKLAELDLEYVFNGVVDDHSNSSITVKLADKSVKKFTVNKDTKFFNISDLDELDDARGVKDDYTVIVIDTDDDNRSADYVIIVSEENILF